MSVVNGGLEAVYSQIKLASRDGDELYGVLLTIVDCAISDKRKKNCNPDNSQCKKNYSMYFDIFYNNKVSLNPDGDSFSWMILQKGVELPLGNSDLANWRGVYCAMKNALDSTG